MQQISNETLDTLERKYAAGLSSSDLLFVCTTHGLPITEATLRKYVQLGLLPRSVRVGRKGKHKGSLGLYPARTIRQLARIKEMMSEHYTIEQIRSDYLFMRADIERLEDTLTSVFQSLSGALAKKRRDGSAPIATREVKNAQRQGERLVEQLSALEYRLTRIESVQAGAMGAKAS